MDGRTFTYPNGRTISVSEETLKTNRFTWVGYQGAVYESDSIRYVYGKLADRVLAHGKATLVDIGAQSGLYALYSRHFEGVRVDAYEPLPRSYRCLLENIALNGVGDRVFPFELAISDTQARATMRCPDYHAGLGTLGATPMRFDAWEEVDVATDTLDNLYADRKVDVVKCDAEGWEYFVLKGGRAVLERDKPELLLEMCEVNMRQCGVTQTQLEDLLSALGYRHVASFGDENAAFSWGPAYAADGNSRSANLHGECATTTLLTIVCCTPEKPERRAHMDALCRQEGLTPTFTTDLGLFVRGDDPACAALGGKFKPHPAFRAHYLTYLAALRYFRSTGAEYGLIFEDDLARRGEFSVHHVIEHAPEFDILFLEYCYADCRNIKWAYKFGGAIYVGGYEAYGTGACVYSQEGARRLLEFVEQREPCVIDHMTALYASTPRGHSHVAYLRPPLFAQDREAFPDGASGPGYCLYANDPSAFDAAVSAADDAEALASVIVVSNWAGFFSTFLKYLAWSLCEPSARVVCLYVDNGRHDDTPRTQIEWATAEQMQKENIWDTMFDQGACARGAISGRRCEIFFPTRGFPAPLSSINGGYICMSAHVYESEHFPAIRAIYHAETRKLRLTPFIQEYIRMNSSALASPSETVAVFVRYPGNYSDSDRFSSGCTRTVHTLISEVASVMAERGLEYIFLVTMVDMYVAAFQEAFPGRVVLFGSKRLASVDTEWFVGYTDYKQEAIDAFSEVYAASTCKYAIGMSSNMLMGCLFLNPALEFKIFECGKNAHGH